MRMESGADARRQGLVKKRRWSGIVKSTNVAETDEGNVRVDDESQPDRSRRSVGSLPLFVLAIAL